VYNQANVGRENKTDELVVALIDVGDVRHVLKTIAQMSRHGKRKLKVSDVTHDLRAVLRRDSV
jgi:hypothetical protein